MRLSPFLLLLAACGRGSSAAAPDLGPPPEGAVVAPPTSAHTAEGATPVAVEKINPRLLRRFVPLRRVILDGEGGPTREQIELGRMLFFDARLSHAGDLSCNSCHRLDNYGVDGRARSPGHNGKLGSRNSPTVYNAAGHISQFWDGRALDVEEQAKGPILNPDEMAMASPAAAVARLDAIPGYREAFKRAFPGEARPVNWKNVGRAIGAFERVLVTPSRWDRFLEGDASALSDEEIVGFKVFSDIGCIQCHTGEFLGGSMFQKVGAVRPWANQADPGRFTVTKQPTDRMMFKVPSLRGITKTGPYFHDSSATTLEDAVRMMADHQLGVELTAEEVTSITTWLGSLTGDLPTELIQPPQLPPS